MRRRTLGFGDCCYHVVSRISERRFYLGKAQKDHLLRLLRAAAYFSGVEILTYCIMDDHFHLLIRVPRPRTISERTLFCRLKTLYKPDEYDAFRREYELYKKTDNDEMAYAFRQHFERRMYDLSEFVRTLKLRFSMWFNRCNEREGPLWTGRFKSVLVQSSADSAGHLALSLVAAYIDLNAVRAKLVRRAQDYPWCGFSAVFDGNRREVRALQYILGRGRRYKPGSVVEKYQQLLNQGLPCRIDCFSAGWILGQHAFVDFVSRRRPECFKTGYYDITQKVSALPDSGLYTIRTSKFVPEAPRNVLQGY